VTDVRDRLERTELPDAGDAQARAWTLVASAYAQREVPRRRRRVPTAFVVALLAVALAVAATPPGAAVGRWVRTVLGGAVPPAPRATLGPLPDGRLLVTSSGGAWIVQSDGSRLRLGDYRDATWSPQGLYVAAWHGRQLSAVAPDGRVAWRIAAPSAVADARWSPDGYRIAYRRGDGLAVIAGDGTAPRLLAARARPVAPAWRPTEAHTLAWVARSGHVVVTDVDSGRVVWRSGATIGRVRELLWSADGRRLLAWRADGARVIDLAADRVRRIALDPVARIDGAAWAPRGQRVALVERRGTTSRLLVVHPSQASLEPGVRMAVAGRLGSVAWSPNGRRVLVRWRERDEWLLVAASGPAPPTAIGRVSRRFAGTPVVRGWCCA
jgi:dipeptidyl aminopeptidase/acylaminoacyl peptidase